MLRILAMAIAGAVLLAVPAAQAAPKKSPRHVKVMTRNIYLGGDIVRPIAGTAGCPDPATCFDRFARANHGLREIVDRTKFPARAKLLAEEIATRKPDLVGLQEVATWRRGPMETTPSPSPTATEVELDFLEILMGALEDAGQRYRVVRVQEQADIEGPAYAPDGSDQRDVRLTIHDVILRRVKKNLRVVRSGGDNFDASLGLTAAGIPVTVLRGHVWADVRLGKKRFRFINTHLESFLSNVARNQARELLKGPAKGRRATVMVGDFNSDPLDGSVKPYDIPHWSAYRLIARKFTDGWDSLRNTNDPGWTAGLSETVDDADTSSIDHRIDMIFTRGEKRGKKKRKRIKAQRGWTTGTENRSPEGLWASDHAGVVLRLKL